jgi:integrase
MSPKRRLQENRGLPARWARKHGAFYYRVPPGQEASWGGKRWFLLGKTLPDAYRAWTERMQIERKERTVGDLFDRYALEVVPKKAPKTQADNVRAIAKLRAVFGTLPIATIEPRHVYRYVDLRKAKTAAHREIEVLSHVYTKAVEWGVIARHPFKGQVELSGQPPRDRYVEDWEVVEALAVQPRQKQGGVRLVLAYIRVKLLTGLRRGDLLRLKVADCRDDGIHVRPHKTAQTTRKRQVILWSDELRAAIEEAKDARAVHISPWVFCNRDGECYVDEAAGTANGWDSLWQRYMARVLAETKVTERFHEHDLRAKCASDAATLEHARQLLAHADARTTDRIYRRAPERVKPLR